MQPFPNIPQVQFPAMAGMGIPSGTPAMSVPPRTAVTLYIGDLDEQINEEMLYLKLVQYGQIFTLKIARDLNRKSRGFAFVTFYQKADGTFLIQPKKRVRLSTTKSFCKTVFVLHSRRTSNPSQMNPTSLLKVSPTQSPQLSSKISLLNSARSSPPNWTFSTNPREPRVMVMFSLKAKNLLRNVSSNRN